MNNNCNCNVNSEKSCINITTLDEIYKIQRKILEGSCQGKNSVIINDSVMTYVPNEDFPVPICDNVRKTIVNYTERNYVKKQVFHETVDYLSSAIKDLDKRVKALEGKDPYDPINEQITLDESSMDEPSEKAITGEIIPVDVDVENDDE